jgi:DNA primase
MNVYVMAIPGSKDPDEFIRGSGPQEFRRLIANAKPAVAYKISVLNEQFESGTIDGRVKFLESVTAVLAAISSEIEREMYVKDISRQYGITEQALNLEIGKKLGNQDAINVYNADFKRRIVKTGNEAGIDYKGKFGQVGTERHSDSGSERLGAGGMAGDLASGVAGREVINRDELFIVALLCVDNSLIDIAAQKMPPEKYEDINIRAAAEYIYKKIALGAEIYPADAVRFFSPEVADLYTAVLTTECHCENNNKALKQKLKDMDKKKNKIRMKELIKMIEREDITNMERDELNSELKSIMSGLNKSGV